MELLKPLQDLIPWAAGLPLLPKLLLSVLIVCIAAFLLALIWVPAGSTANAVGPGAENAAACPDQRLNEDKKRLLTHIFINESQASVYSDKYELETVVTGSQRWATEYTPAYIAQTKNEEHPKTWSPQDRARRHRWLDAFYELRTRELLLEQPNFGDLP